MYFEFKTINIFCKYDTVSVSVYLGTIINKQQIMPQKTNHIRTAFILFPGHLKQPYGFLVDALISNRDKKPS